MYQYEDIRVVHLEITSQCNASCPLCSRNVLGGKVNPFLPLTELTLEDIKMIFPVDLLCRLELIYLCGNYGDPMVARDSLSALEYFRESNQKLKLGFHTNGSGRSADWWKRLAKTVDYCYFGIDGLEDTNYIYRRGTKWEKIIEAASAFIEAGGNAIWQFIVFKHNEHQIEKARELSRQIGFNDFQVRKTYRFFTPVSGIRREGSPVIDRQGNLEYVLEEPKGQELRNPVLDQMSEVAGNDYRKYLDSTEISCKVALEKKIYVSAEGLVFPCCWVAGIYSTFQTSKSTAVGRMIAKMPDRKDSLNAKVLTIEQIIQGEFFQKMIPESWHKNSLKNGKLEVCGRICGKHDIYAGQF